jgi:hypothetical protein
VEPSATEGTDGPFDATSATAGGPQCPVRARFGQGSSARNQVTGTRSTELWWRHSLPLFEVQQLRSVVLPGDPQAFATNGGILRGLPEQPARSARSGRMSARPVRWNFLGDYTEINKLFWRWAAMLGSIVYINISCVRNLYLSYLELVLK